ncbi:MAG: tetratricopeptide repeat protein [Acidobacteriota bacterium]|nr:tetratricopeptide repeat protein [Acidobacteriota bacterium]
MDELLDVLKHAIVDTLRGERWGEALPMLEECCERFPEDTRSWLNRGYCLVRLGRYQEAVAAFNRCLGLDPNLEKARKWRDRVVTEPLLFLKTPKAVNGHGSDINISEH